MGCLDLISGVSYSPFGVRAREQSCFVGVFSVRIESLIRDPMLAARYLFVALGIELFIHLLHAKTPLSRKHDASLPEYED